jgi:hypothetical protein
MATKTKKIGFARLSKAERARVSSLGGKANAKKMRKMKKG